jgi:glycerol-3-phosphate dehydrogenase
LITVTGGKLTTYRKMAADAVDMAARELSPGRGRTLRRSPTRRLKLVGASPARASSGVGLDPATYAHLRGRHGFETEKVLALAGTNPSLAGPLVEGLLYLRAEAVWAVREEMAHTLIDVLARRTRALMLDREATARAAPEVAALIASELGWDDAETSRQLSNLQRHVEADRGALDLATRRAPEAAAGTSAGRETGPRGTP